MIYIIFLYYGVFINPKLPQKGDIGIIVYGTYPAYLSYEEKIMADAEGITMLNREAGVKVTVSLSDYLGMGIETVFSMNPWGGAGIWVVKGEKLKGLLNLSSGFTFENLLFTAQAFLGTGIDISKNTSFYGGIRGFYYPRMYLGIGYKEYNGYFLSEKIISSKLEILLCAGFYMRFNLQRKKFLDYFIPRGLMLETGFSATQKHKNIIFGIALEGVLYPVFLFLM